MWHLSSIPDHETVFKPESPLLVESPSASQTTGTPANDNLDSASVGVLSASSGGNWPGGGASFGERVVGKTWSGFPAVVLRSLRICGRDEAARAARWLRGDGGDGGSVFGDDDDWTDQRLRLLADEWKACAGLGAMRYGIDDAGMASGPENAAILNPPPRPKVVARPFMVHPGHLIVPFLNGRVREKGGAVIGHGVVLAVDRGVDWRQWEPHLTDVAGMATRCFECLELEGAVAEKARVSTWADNLIHRARDRSPVTDSGKHGKAGDMTDTS